MGIAASYTGNGVTRTFELDGVPPVGSLAADMLGAQAMRAPQLLGSVAPLAMPFVPEMPSMSDTANKMKMMPNGSLSDLSGEMCLKGEEGGVAGGRRVYASNNGHRGFFTLGELDPYAGGTLLNGTGGTPDGAEASLDGNTGATVRFGGRIDMKIDTARDGKRWLTVKEFYRLASISPNGRITRISKENERLVLMFEVGGNGSGSGNGKYGVRPFFVEADAEDKVHPVPDAFAFGAEADLDTYDESSGQFACNYDGSGNLLGDPPVKVVMTTPNTGGS